MILTHAEVLPGEDGHDARAIDSDWLRAQPALAPNGLDPYFNSNLDPGIERIALRASL